MKASSTMRGRRALAAAAVLMALAVLPQAWATAESPRLFLLITADTLRADRLGAYGSERALTPTLDALAAESLVFTAAYAPASFTVPSVAALMTGRYPQELGVWNNESGVQGASTLAALLQARGWKTFAAVGNFVLRRGSGLEAGFDAYDDRFASHEATGSVPEREAAATTDAALRQLDRCTAGGPKCFLWVHYQDPHGPYSPPAGWRERQLPRERAAPDGQRELRKLDTVVGLGGIPSYQFLGPTEVAFYRAGYDAEIAYMDQEIGRLLRALRERGLDRDAVILFAADHGESLGERDYWFAHGEHLTDVLVRVPLLLRAPGLEPGRRHDTASLVDLVPTMMPRLTGEPALVGYPGRDLLTPASASAPRPVLLATLGGSRIPRVGVVSEGFKLVAERRRGGWSAALYRSGDDERDVKHEYPHVAARMQREAQNLARLLQTTQFRKGQSFDESVRKRLRSLGYAD